MATARSAHPAPHRVSVVIPVRNGAATIGEQLEALAAQTYRGDWELIVADNGSTDATRAVAEGWSDRLPVVVVDASQRPGSSYARNEGAARAAGEVLAFCDADDVVGPEWLDGIVRGLAGHDAVTGRQEIGAINEPYIQTWRPVRATGLPRAGFLPYAPSCNLGVWKSVFERTGGFDEEYPQSHDVEWSWRMQLASFTLGYAEGAVVHYRYRTDVRGVFRQAYLSGLDAARLYRDYAGRGMPRPRLGRTVRTWAWLVARLPYLASAHRRGIWARRAGEAAGRVAGSVRFRVLFL